MDESILNDLMQHEELHRKKAHTQSMPKELSNSFAVNKVQFVQVATLLINPARPRLNAHVAKKQLQIYKIFLLPK